jgi:ligand-binding SRPBCC domain-containing protein
MIELQFESELAASREQVWAQISTWSGVNAELYPFFRMSVPAGLDSLERPAACFGERFCSWVLLFGMLPVDRHCLRFESVRPGLGFEENSSTWLHRRWRHHRVLTQPAEGGLRVCDTIRYQSRWRPLERLTRPVIAALFRHRHAQLRLAFGDATGGTSG